MSASEILRVRLDPDLKSGVTKMYDQRGTTVSQAVRSFLESEYEAYVSAPDAFDSIMAAADAKLEASGLGSPTIEEINDYIGRARAERAGAALAAS